MPTAEEMDITELPRLVEALAAADREVFERIFHVDVTTGRIVPPDAMRPWIERYFGSVDATLEQTVVRITDRVAGRGALFNPLRSRRPNAGARSGPIDVAAEFAPPREDPLADPLSTTPADSFGRVEGRYCVTGSNVAKFDGFHALVIFKERDPLHFTREMLHDYIDTGFRWAEEAHRVDPEARYFLFMWNCLWRAGASLTHGHAQVLLGRHCHYPAVERLRLDALSYRERYSASYFDDLYRAHAAVGCGFEKEGVRVMAALAPVKENEIVLMAPAVDASLKDRLFETLSFYRDRLGVASFNVAFYLPPIAPVGEDWSGFPAIVHVVDRGDPASRVSDIGAMELYAASVIACDPLRLASQLRNALSA